MDKASISVGNVVGSNFFNLYFILGIVAISGVVATDKKIVYRDGGVLILSSLMLIWFFSDGLLSRFEGIVLMLMLVTYVIYLVVKKEVSEEIHPSSEFKWYHTLQFIAGVTIIIISGDLLVESASDLARYFGISEWVIGLTIVAAGTSLPELATSLVAIGKGNVGLSAGNLIGSNIFNLFGVLGLAGAIKPLNMASGTYQDILILFASIVLVVIFMRTGWRVSKLEGSFLFLAVLAKWVFDLIN
jgi:cation:H+ antiporter